jgi:RNA polymerase sigma-70 factor (ECF subfamily)
LKSDAQLIETVLRGETAAFGELAARYERTLRALAFTVLRDSHAAADATQEALLAAYQGLSGLKDREAFGAWAVQIVRRRAWALAGARRPMVPLGATAEMSAPELPNLDLDEERLMAALMKLPESERLVLMLRHFDGHAIADIALMHGESPGTVSKRISRAHERLRELLREDSL